MHSDIVIRFSRRPTPLEQVEDATRDYKNGDGYTDNDGCYSPSFQAVR